MDQQIGLIHNQIKYSNPSNMSEFSEYWLKENLIKS